MKQNDPLAMVDGFYYLRPYSSLADTIGLLVNGKWEVLGGADVASCHIMCPVPSLDTAETLHKLVQTMGLGNVEEMF